MKKVYSVLFFLMGIGALGFSAMAFFNPSAISLQFMGAVIPPWAAGLAVAVVTLSPSFAVVVTGSPLPHLVKNAAYMVLRSKK